MLIVLIVTTENCFLDLIVWLPDILISLLCGPTKINFLRIRCFLILLWHSGLCPTCHGDYPARINKVINGKVECPYCNNKKVLPGFNSLAIKYPDIANMWSITK